MRTQDKEDLGCLLILAVVLIVSFTCSIRVKEVCLEKGHKWPTEWKHYENEYNSKGEMVLYQNCRRCHQMIYKNNE